MGITALAEPYAFRYSTEQAFLYRNLKLTLTPGRLIVLTGPSGCGKSTVPKLFFIAHQIPKGLAVDDIFTLSPDRSTQMRVVDDAHS